jgi:hypothetical protein
MVVLLVAVPGGSDNLRLSERDHGRTIHVQAGQQVTLSLHQQAGHGPWTRPTSSDTTVLQPAADNTVPARRLIRGFFRAVRSGRAQLTAEAPAECEPSPCTQPPSTFTVSVIVDR